MAILSVALLVTAFFAGVLYCFGPELSRSPSGHWILFVGLVLIPVSIAYGGLFHALKSSRETQFCMSCHEMEPYGRSLFVDNPKSLVSAHYQKRLIPRTTTCYDCHTNYAMFGDVQTKWNGLLHVWAHYTGTIADPIELYAPYPNANCLHCHEDARGYLEEPAHAGQFEAMSDNGTSCLKCHSVAHDLEGTHAGTYWKGHKQGGEPKP